MNRKTKKGFDSPMRTCIGCRESKPKKDMIRIACYEGEISVDVTGRAKGRGVYVCLDEACIAKAYKTKALMRSLGMQIEKETLDRIFEELNGQNEDA